MERQTNCTKKDSNEPNSYEGVVSHTEPDILECEVKWALKSTNKASGCDEIPVETTELEKISFHSSPKEGQCQRMFKLPHDCTHFTY